MTWPLPSWLQCTFHDRFVSTYLDSCPAFFVAGSELGHFHDALHGFEFVAVVQPQPLQSPHELLVGCVQSDCCGLCFAGGTPSLCYHKSQVNVRAELSGIVAALMFY
jgi:hypothetical protein